MTLDLIACGLVLFFAVIGAMAGGLMQLSHWAGLALGVLAAKPLGLLLGPELAARLHVPLLVGALGAMVVLFFTVYMGVQGMARILIKRTVKHRQLGRADGALGFLLGAGRAAFIVYLLLSALVFFEKPFAHLTRYRFDTRGSHVAAWVRAHDLFTSFGLPGTQGISRLARAAKDPAAAAALAHDPAFQRLLRDPRVAPLLRDGALRRELQRGDALNLLRDDRVMKVLTDPGLRRSFEHLGASPTTSP